MVKHLLVLSKPIAALALTLAAACTAAPLPLETPASESTATPEVTLVGTTVFVQSVEVQGLDSDPLEVTALVRGQLPDACSFIEGYELEFKEQTFKITMTGVRRPDARCAQMLTPFEQEVPLDVSGLPTGEYTVDVNGMTTQFDLE
jgi:inhibitor of cysteine peptidase